MPKPRASRLETPTARRKLAVRKKPYYVRLSPGIHLGYRRNVAAGTWTSAGRRERCRVDQENRPR